VKLDLDFAYAQARIQARFASLPSEAEWQRVAASRSLASFLEEARTGCLRDWVKGFSGQSDVHYLEEGLRSLFREDLESVVGWVPVHWRESVSWVRWLALLPLLAHLRAGGAMPRWAARDSLLQVLAGGGDELNMRCLEDAGARCLLQADAGVAAAWAAEWRRRWPPCSREASRALEALRVLLVAHLDAFRQASPESAWPLRRDLRERLRLRFRRHTLQPAVPFIYLAMVALDLERLRAALLRRVLFSAQDEPAWHGTAT
jgi:hypothetical protein